MLTSGYNREVQFYKKKNLRCPAEEFLDNLSAKAVQKVTWTLRLIRDLEVVPVQYFSKISGADDIWECRIKLGSDIYRIFAFWDEGKVILTHGFRKKTQKTPKNEIERAETYKKDYFEIKKEQL